MRSFLQRIPATMQGSMVQREEPCKVCGAAMGMRIAEVDYWDIKSARLVKCPDCAHTQLDPMLTDAETAKGCYAYYIEECLRTSDREELKNRIRNFRRGVVFARSLKKKGIVLRDILELGPGSGYFCAGMQFVIPGIQVTVIDINQELLDFNKDHHGYEGYLEVPDRYVPGCEGRFDLVIARDIIEHVSDISSVLTNVNRYLRPNGHFHFITPNGHEDVWKHYLTSTVGGRTSELLINHVNYFDGKGLKQLLIGKGFTPVEYYTYQVKTTVRGRGWKHSDKLKSPVSRKLSAGRMIEENASRISSVEVPKKELLDKWYIRKKARWLTYLYSAYQHHHLIKLDPELNVGHEIHGLFRKVMELDPHAGKA
jgi:SAM-dependent methyltransferase